MADQEFNIKVITTANTAGLDKIKADLTALGAQVKSINAVGGGGGGGGGDVLDKAATKIEHGIFRTAVHAIGIGVVYELVGALREAGKEIEKASELLDKQGEKLLVNAQLFDEQARNAKDVSDVLKVSDATLKDMAEAKKTFNELSQKELGYAASFSDYLQKQMFARQRMAGMGDYEAANLENTKTAFQQYQATRERAMRELLEADAASKKSTQERIALLDREIQQQEKLKQAAIKNIDPSGYAEAGNKQLRLVQQLNAENSKAVAEQEKAYGESSPQAKAILRNEKAAREARAAGDERSADQFQKSADQFRSGASAKDLSDVQKVIDTYAKEQRPGRAAGVGESQELVDQIERQRIAAEKQSAAVTAAQESVTPEESKPYEDPRAAEIERQTQEANASREASTKEPNQAADIEKGMQELKTAIDGQTTWMKQTWGY